jgi:hypothetical protein
LQVRYYYIKTGFTDSYSTVVSYYIIATPVSGSLDDATDYFSQLSYADRILLWTIITFIATIFIGAFSKRGDVTAIVGALVGLMLAYIILGTAGAIIVMLVAIVIIAFAFGFAGI